MFMFLIQTHKLGLNLQLEVEIHLSLEQPIRVLYWEIKDTSLEDECWEKALQGTRKGQEVSWGFSYSSFWEERAPFSKVGARAGKRRWWSKSIVPGIIWKQAQKYYVDSVPPGTEELKTTPSSAFLKRGKSAKRSWTASSWKLNLQYNSTFLSSPPLIRVLCIELCYSKMIKYLQFWGPQCCFFPTLSSSV